MKTRWLLVALLLLGAALRFHRLEAQSFWNDEGNSARLSERTPALIVEGTASDVHPPLYYLALHGWRELAGDTEFGLRAFSTYAGVLAVAATTALARRWWGAGIPVLATTLFIAVNPALVYYSQEARMYELLALLAALSTLLLLALLPVLHRKTPSALAALYVLAVAAGLYTHYFFPVVLAVHGLVVLSKPWSSRWQPLLRWATLVAVSLLLYAPWISIFLRQTGGRPGNETSFFTFVGDAAGWLALGPTAAAGAWWLLVALALVIAFAAWPKRARSQANSPVPGVLLALAGVLLPILFMWFAQATRPAFDKFLVVAVPFLALLFGRGSGILLGGAGRRRVPVLLLGAGLLALFLVGNTQALLKLYGDPVYARADYRSMAARIAAEDHPNAGIILNAANQWEVFTYYHRDGAPVYPIPRGAPDAGAIAAELAEIAARHDRLYAIFWGEAERDPERLVERWLDTHAFKATDEWVGDVRFVVYAVPPEAAQSMETEVDAQFGEAITLHGYTIGNTEVAAGDIIPVTLFWETVQPLQERYKVFLHLTAGSGAPVAQRDSEPGGGLALTSTWLPGAIVVDNHGVFVPPATQPGDYQLVLGLYKLADANSRLVLPSGDDALTVATITVR